MTSMESKENGEKRMWKWFVLGGIVVTVWMVFASRQNVNTSKTTFDDYLKNLSAKSDQLAKKQMKSSTANNVVGGKCEILISTDDPSNVLAVLKIYKHKGKDSEWTVSEYTIKKPVNAFSDDDMTQMKLKQISKAPLVLDFEIPQ